MESYHRSPRGAIRTTADTYPGRPPRHAVSSRRFAGGAPYRLRVVVEPLHLHFDQGPAEHHVIHPHSESATVTPGPRAVHAVRDHHQVRSRRKGRGELRRHRRWTGEVVRTDNQQNLGTDLPRPRNRVAVFQEEVSIGLAVAARTGSSRIWEQLKQALAEFRDRYNREWLIELLGYQSLQQARERLLALEQAAWLCCICRPGNLGQYIHTQT